MTPALHAAGPVVLLAAPGMLQSGPSREAFEAWAGAAANLVVLTGYAVRGTLADDLRREPQTLQLHDRQMRRRCGVEVISFSAHSDYNQTKDFIDKLRVPNVVLVHGERSEMRRLKEKLVRENPALSVFTPEILQSVVLHFAPSRRAVAVGEAARLLEEKDEEALDLRGEGRGTGDWDALLLLREGEHPVLVKADEAEGVAGVECCTLKQQIRVPFPKPLQLLRRAAQSLFEDVTLLRCACREPPSVLANERPPNGESCEVKAEENAFSAAASNSKRPRREASEGPPPCCGKCGFLVAESVTVRREASGAAGSSQGLSESASKILVEWISSPSADVVADALLFLACDLLKPLLFQESLENGASPSAPDGCCCKASPEGAVPPVLKNEQKVEEEKALMDILRVHLEEHFGVVKVYSKAALSRAMDATGEARCSDFDFGAPDKSVGATAKSSALAVLAKAAVDRRAVEEISVEEAADEAVRSGAAFDAWMYVGAHTDWQTGYTSNLSAAGPSEEATFASRTATSNGSGMEIDSNADDCLSSEGAVVPVLIDFAQRKVSCVLVHFYRGAALPMTCKTGLSNCAEHYVKSLASRIERRQIT